MQPITVALIVIWVAGIGVLAGDFVRRRRAPRVAIPSGSTAERTASGNPADTAARRSWAVRVGEWPRVDSVGIPFALFVVTAIGYALINRGREAGLDYFVPLADAFVHGHTGLATGGNAHFGFLSEMLKGDEGATTSPIPLRPPRLPCPLSQSSASASTRRG